jgi:hypothetical protein
MLAPVRFPLTPEEQPLTSFFHHVILLPSYQNILVTFEKEAEASHCLIET